MFSSSVNPHNRPLACCCIALFLITLVGSIGCNASSDVTSVATSLKSVEEAREQRVEPKRKYVALRSKSAYKSFPDSAHSIAIGLDADMSSGSARSGEAIRRGLELAIEEINATGGLLGKQVELIVRDHRGNPDRGLGNLEAFSQVPRLLGVFGGIHTPVAMRELEFIHQNKMLYLCPWAAGTPIVSNGYSPNYVFRVSVRDEYAGGFLVSESLARGFSRVGLLLDCSF